jgi:hypothetical protein
MALRDVWCWRYAAFNRFNAEMKQAHGRLLMV